MSVEGCGLALDCDGIGGRCDGVNCGIEGKGGWTFCVGLVDGWVLGVMVGIMTGMGFNKVGGLEVVEIILDLCFRCDICGPRRGNEMESSSGNESRVKSMKATCTTSVGLTTLGSTDKTALGLTTCESADAIGLSLITRGGVGRRALGSTTC